MKIIFSTIILCCAFQIQLNGQITQRSIVIYDIEAIINADYDGGLHYLFNIKSKEKKSGSDAYKFILKNRNGFEYKKLTDIGKNVDLDTLEYSTISDLSKIENCELHELLSKKQEIFLVTKEKKRISSMARCMFPTRYFL